MSVATTLRSVMAVLAVVVIAPGCQTEESTSSKIPPVSVPAATGGAAPQYQSSMEEGIKFWLPGFPDFVSDVAGFAAQEDWGRWTTGPVAVIKFTRSLPSEFELVVTGAAFGPNIGQPIQFISGAVTRSAVFSNALGKGLPEVKRMHFVLTQQSDKIEIRIPRPIAPGNGDGREVGIALIKLQILRP